MPATFPARLPTQSCISRPFCTLEPRSRARDRSRMALSQQALRRQARLAPGSGSRKPAVARAAAARQQAAGAGAWRWRGEPAACSRRVSAVAARLSAQLGAPEPLRAPPAANSGAPATARLRLVLRATRCARQPAARRSRSSGQTPRFDAAHAAQRAARPPLPQVWLPCCCRPPSRGARRRRACWRPQQLQLQLPAAGAPSHAAQLPPPRVSARARGGRTRSSRHVHASAACARQPSGGYTHVMLCACRARLHLPTTRNHATHHHRTHAACLRAAVAQRPQQPPRPARRW